MRIISALVTILCLSILASATKTQVLGDQGAPDSILFKLNATEVINDEAKLAAELFFFNDIQNLASAAIGFTWDNPDLQMDSARMTPLAIEAVNFIRQLFPSTDPGEPNLSQLFMFGGAKITGNGLVASDSAQHVATYWFTYSLSGGGAACVDTVSFGGIKYMFIGFDSNFWFPDWSGSQCVSAGDNDGDGIIDLIDNCQRDPNGDQLDTNNDGVGDACCCVGRTGNIDGDPGDIVDITDLTFLIDHLFISFTPLPCVKEANVDGDSSSVVDVTDVTRLIDHLFLNFEPTADCQ